MRLFRRLWLISVAAAACVVAAAPENLPWTGSVAGGVTIIPLPNAPKLQWRATAQPTNVGWKIRSEATGTGTRISVESDFDQGTQSGTWKITESTIAIAAWEAALRTEFGSAATGLEFTGEVTLTGAGDWRGGKPTGEITLALKNGRIANAASGWTLDGVTVGGQFAVNPATRTVRSTVPLTLTIATITTKRFGARNLVAHGMLESARSLRLSSVRVEIAGGDMAAGATEIELRPLRFLTEVTINRIGLQDVAALVPSTLKNARGRVDGTVQLGWADDELQLGRGHLTLRDDEPAEVTLRPYPGLFTSWMRPWMKHLPAWLVKWPGPNLEKAELGQAPIEAKTLDVTFSPQPDANGRTATVHLVGLPKGASRTPVDITTNVFGPLKPFIQLGTETNLSFAIGK